jgi:hypothetical protein
MWFPCLTFIFLFLTANTISSAAADSATNGTYRQTLAGQVSQNRGRLVINRAAADVIPPTAPSFRNPLTGSVNAAYASSSASKYADSTSTADLRGAVARGSYGGIVNVSQFSAQTQSSQLAAQAQRPQYSAQAQTSQYSAHAQKTQAPAQAQKAYANNPAVRQAEMEALGVGLNSAGLGAWHCPVCRLLKGF